MSALASAMKGATPKKGKKGLWVNSRGMNSCPAKDENLSPSLKTLSPRISGETSSVDINENGQTGSALNDPAIVAAGRPRRQPLTKKTAGTNVVGVELRGASKEDDTSTKENLQPSKPAVMEKTQVKVSKVSRAVRRGRGSNQQFKKSSSKSLSEGEETAEQPPAKESTILKTASTPPRFQTVKLKRSRAAAGRADESIESDASQSDEKLRSVRFQADLPKDVSKAEPKMVNPKPSDSVSCLSPGALAQQIAIQDAAALLASSMPNLANPLYANMLTTKLAQQQLATAQVLANLHASVGFNPLKNIEPASAYDATRVPCLGGERDEMAAATNVYVNNLPAHTTDDDLLRLGACFGPVKSHKAIINQETGLCKGYGFIMYESALDAETALQQLPLHGLTTSWAKESFSTKLRKLSDNSSTNVYVSNLPLEMTPLQLEQLFSPHNIVSLRILLDDNGLSRGVGFVRLKDRDTAQECIDKLHGKLLPSQTTPLQARFADSEAQKRLKQTVNQPAGQAVSTASSLTSHGTSMASGVLNAKSSTTALFDGANIADPTYLASLQGLQNWAGFGTPQNSNGAAFMSPSLGLTSPAMNYAQWSPSMAANAASNWSLLAQDVFGNPMLNPNSGGFGLGYGNHLYSPSSMTTSLNSPFSQFTNKSLSPMSFTSTPLSAVTPILPTSEHGSRSGSTRNKPTYLPPDVHQQHAKALLEAQVGLAFDSPQAEAFGLSTLLFSGKNGGLDANTISCEPASLPCPQHAADTKGNVLGMSGMEVPSPSQDTSLASGAHSLPTTAAQMSPTMSLSNVVSGPIASLSPIRFSVSKDPTNPIYVEAVDPTTAAANEGKPLVQGCTEAPTKVGLKNETITIGSTGQGQDGTLEEGDSLVIESGHSSAVGQFSLQKAPAKHNHSATLPKSDSGKSFDLQPNPETANQEMEGGSAVVQVVDVA